MTRTDELFGALDPERRAQLEAARTSRTFGAVDEVLVAAGFPRRSEKGGVIDVYPLPSELSSEQRAHSDKVLVSPPYIGPYDRETLAASWLALEASSEANGALIIYPGSHKLPKRGLFDGFEESYAAYTNWLDTWLQENGFKAVTFRAEPGDILFWHGDFIHAGGAIQSPSDTPPTRKSLVCHYASIPAEQASLDAGWTRVSISGGTYYQRVKQTAEQTPRSLMQRIKSRMASLMQKSSAS